MNKLLQIAALVLPLTFTFAASAEELGNDEVTLKNGGSVRGTVISVSPGEKVVVMELGQTERREIPWAEVADVEKGKYAAAKPEEEEPAPKRSSTKRAPVEEEEAGGPGMVKLHIESDEPVQVYERLGGGAGQVGHYMVVIETFRSVCASPCDRIIDGSRGATYFVSGPGVTDSSDFTLTDKQGATTLTVDAGSSAQRFAGRFMTFTGIAAAVGGGVLIAIDSALADPTSDDNTMTIAGGVMLGVGVGLIAGGIPLWVTSSTDLDWSNGASTARVDGRPREVKPRYWLGEF